MRLYPLIMNDFKASNSNKKRHTDSTRYSRTTLVVVTLSQFTEISDAVDGVGSNSFEVVAAGMQSNSFIGAM